MATPITNNDPYPATPEQLIAMLGDPNYAAAKYVALEDRKTEVKVQELTADGLRLEIHREVDANLPSVAKKVLGDTNFLIQRETWTKTESGYHCEAVLDSPGKPVQRGGTMDIISTGDGTSKWLIDWEVKASVPLVGKKIEAIVADEAKGNFVKELNFNLQWLKENG